MRARRALAGVLLTVTLAPLAWGCAVTVLCLDSSRYKDESRVEHRHERLWSLFGKSCEKEGDK